MNSRFNINFSNTDLDDFDDLIDSCMRNPLLASSQSIMINLSCNGHVDARTIQNIIARPELPYKASIIVDVSMSGVSPEDLQELVRDPRISVLRCTGNNVDTDLSLSLIEHARRRPPMWLDLEWNCINRNHLKKRIPEGAKVIIAKEFPELPDDENHVVVVGIQNPNLLPPLALPCLSRNYRLKDERLMNQFMKELVGSTWGDLVLRPSEIPVSITADAAIEIITPSILASCLRKCLDEDFDRVPALKLYKFGSCVNGFASRTSDVDLVVAPADFADIKWFARQFRSADSQKRLAQDFLYYLEQYLAAHANTELVKHARVPVLKLSKFVVSGSESTDVDITFMNTVCLLNSKLLRKYAQSSESTFILVHLVKVWANNNRFVSHELNGFTFPTSYAWVLICIFFLQERLHAVDCFCATSGPTSTIWGCRTGAFLDAESIGISDTDNDLLLPLPKSPLTLFFMFMHFLVNETNNLVIDLLGGWREKKTDSVLTVLDPIEIERNVTRNVSEENWDLVKETAETCLERLEKVKSFGEFLDVVDTKVERRPVNANGAPYSGNLFVF